LGSQRKEIEFFLNKIAEFRDEFHHNNDLYNVVAVRPDSDFYQALRKIVKTNQKEFCIGVYIPLFKSEGRI